MADPTGTRVLVVAGIPASGKSQFSRKLRDRCFYYFTLNGEDDRWQTEAPQVRAYQAYSRGDADALIQALREVPGPLVIEYGFPPDPGNMAIVRALRAAGPFVWFACPVDVGSATRSAARPATISASTSSRPDWSEGDTFTDKERRRFRIVFDLPAPIPVGAFGLTAREDSRCNPVRAGPAKNDPLAG